MTSPPPPDISAFPVPDAESQQHMLRAQQLQVEVESKVCFRVLPIEKLYVLGPEVIPGEEEPSQNHNSSSSGAPNNNTNYGFSPLSPEEKLKLNEKPKAVMFAARKSDGKKVVIKRRSKKSSFKDSSEVTEWILVMKVLYHISGGKEQEKSESSSDGSSRRGRLKYVANLVDIIEDEDNYYAVMEHVQGRDLFDFFVQEKVYTQPKRIQIARHLCKQILRGIQELHSNGLVHKDLKLENLVLAEQTNVTPGGNTNTNSNGSSSSTMAALDVLNPVIIDFDTVELLKQADQTFFHVLGTDQYIAPESYKGLVTFQTDIWALGVILYTLLTGSFPFHYALFDDQPGENYVGHPRMDQISRRLRIAKIDWSGRVWAEGDAADDVNNSNINNSLTGGSKTPVKNPSHDSTATSTSLTQVKDATGLPGPLARDFVRACFVCDPRKRMTMGEARGHAWLTGGK